ncbi:SIR2 family protein [Solimicrobium silvestre]|uniref:SIR2-like domain n=1 Tax=Solimicrobium silvestre TaxID=2099400 RepID=A0A2S9H370_9BURK|nr:SIR2 family protein [Solimicrobium silvestre]PRC94421.1 SIR2-like domain [Solimicrobium silvestre]
MDTITASAQDALKKELQAIFSDGLVTIVGSGLSCAEGLPGMGALATELASKVPSAIPDADKSTWTAIEACLTSDGLEGALLKHAPTDNIESVVIKITAAFVLLKEQEVMTACMNGTRKLKIANLFPHISAANPKIAHIITTNYDRLIEFAAESEGWGVDSMMVGRYWGKHDPDLSDKLMVKSLSNGNKGTVRLLYRNHVKLFKPHGSLDWFMAGDTPMTCSMAFPSDPLIITPGAGKYKKGYGQPFDAHRERGNAAIDSASSILCIGYGFNDDHLQTHLSPKLKGGTKALLLTRDLSTTARAIVVQSSNCIALVSCADAASPGTIVVRGTTETLIPNMQWWDVENFVKGVLTI